MVSKHERIKLKDNGNQEKSYIPTSASSDLHRFGSDSTAFLSRRLLTIPALLVPCKGE